MKEDFYHYLCKELDAISIEETKVIQELWSGYGEIIRLTYLDKKKSKNTVIVKKISYPKEANHPRGWNSNKSHLRKKRSYEIESFWYKEFNYKLNEARIPTFIMSGFFEQWQFIVLEDLYQDSYRPKCTISNNEIKLCLNWLASFHKLHLLKSYVGLWDIGTYWHLDTRPDELEALEDQRLKSAAAKIDSRLNLVKYQTIVHGDAKLANFLFTDDSVAAVDFQYVGGGVGVKDVAYFLSSIYDEQQLELYSAEWLDFYFKSLNEPEVEKEWRELYPFAWADFYRFLKGWSPGHSKINSYSEKMKEKVLACL